jgi:hypothetical protein
MTSPAIEQLQELPLPASVSYLPQTWGWLLVLVIALLTMATWLAWRGYRWRQDRYRRAALARLDVLAQRLDNAALREVPELLKRVALSMPRHPDVASLTGAQWQAFMQTRAAVALPDDFSARLALLAYAPDAHLHTLGQPQRLELLRLSRQWVETHHVAA